MSVNYSAMNMAILDYIRAKIPKDLNKAHIGTVQGNRVIIGNASHSFIPAVDMYFGNGDQVACIQPEGTSTAVIVGVL